jgi:hypothetical protein
MKHNGVQNVLSNFYKGFLYQFCEYQYGVTDWSDMWVIVGPSECIGGCTSCPLYNGETRCVKNCPLNMYWDDVLQDCMSCRSDCPCSCVRPDNCSPCADLECLDCVSYGAGSVCESCVANADKSPTDCVCRQHYNYSIDMH